MTGASGPERRRGPKREEERAERRVVDRADYDPAHDPKAPIRCEVCGGAMFYTAACKLRCPRCGYARDCSDP